MLVFFAVIFDYTIRNCYRDIIVIMIFCLFIDRDMIFQYRSALESGTVAHIAICSPRNFSGIVDCYVIGLWHFTGG